MDMDGTALKLRRVEAAMDKTSALLVAVEKAAIVGRVAVQRIATVLHVVLKNAAMHTAIVELKKVAMDAAIAMTHVELKKVAMDAAIAVTHVELAMDAAIVVAMGMAIVKGGPADVAATVDVTTTGHATIARENAAITAYKGVHVKPTDITTAKIQLVVVNVREVALYIPVVRLAVISSNPITTSTSTWQEAVRTSS